MCDKYHPLKYKLTEFSLQMTAGKEIDIPLTLHVSKDQNLDLYYLTDISKSMTNDVEILKQIGADLEEALRNITSK